MMRTLLLAAVFLALLASQSDAFWHGSVAVPTVCTATGAMDFSICSNIGITAALP